MIREELFVGVAILFGVSLFGLIGKIEQKSSEVTAAHVKEASDRKQDLKPADRIALTHPLPCDAWVSYSGTPGELPRTRCYQLPVNR